MDKDCDTCKFEDYSADNEPCKRCIIAEFPDTYWEPKEGSKEDA